MLTVKDLWKHRRKLSGLGNYPERLKSEEEEGIITPISRLKELVENVMKSD